MESEELEKRLRAIEDIEEIKNLHHEYIFWVNNCQVDEILQLFTEDGTADFGELGIFRGKTEITKIFRRVIPQVPLKKPRDGHFVTQPVLSVDGDKAKGHWLLYIMIADPETGQALRWIQGRQNMEYVKENGKWRFKSLQFIHTWPTLPVVKPE
jgi:ketosteroid isomerase-like protein